MKLSNLGLMFLAVAIIAQVRSILLFGSTSLSGYAIIFGIAGAIMLDIHESNLASRHEEYGYCDYCLDEMHAACYLPECLCPCIK